MVGELLLGSLVSRTSIGICSVGQSLVARCAQGLEWEFMVINSDQLNAFVVPGGKVIQPVWLQRLLRCRVYLGKHAHVDARRRTPFS